jgi:hypothetical protein
VRSTLIRVREEDVPIVAGEAPHDSSSETARANSRAAVCVSTVIETSTTSMEPSVERVSR